MREDDDKKKLSNKYRQLGMDWAIEGTDICCSPKAFRVSLAVSCDSERFEKLRLMLLTPEHLDLLNFCLGHVPPDFRCCDFGSLVKGSIRKAFRRSHKKSHAAIAAEVVGDECGV